MGIYFQVYNLRIDPETKHSSAVVDYIIRRGEEEVVRMRETSDELQQRGNQLTIEKLVPLTRLAPGKYSLEIQVTDTLSQQTVSSKAEFTVKPAPTTAAARY
jgi:hypothetical protein